MLQLFKKTTKKIGLPPGTLVQVEEKKAEKAKISLIDYDEAQFQEKEARTLRNAFLLKIRLHLPG